MMMKPLSQATAATTAAGAGDIREAITNPGAFEVWYRRTLPRVYAYLMSRSGGDGDLAEELAQQTYVAAIEQRARFEGRSDSVTWLLGIARHKLADHYRAIERGERRLLRMRVQQIAAMSAVRGNPEMEDRDAIAEAFRSLPPAQRAMLAFVAQDGLTVTDAGRLIGKGPSAAQSLLHRARQSFRQAYRTEVTDD